MMPPLARELAVDGIPVAVTCRVLKLARQPYYRWLANPVTDAELAEAFRASALLGAHRDEPEFGYRFLVAEAVASCAPWPTFPHSSAGSPVAGRPHWCESR